MSPPPAPSSSPAKPRINLLKGYPNPTLHPVAQLKTAADTVFNNPALIHTGLLYGPDPGYDPLREQIALWLTHFYSPPFQNGGRVIEKDRICISGGASQNLACVLQVVTDPVGTRGVWVVAPCYYLAGRIFEDAGFGGRLWAVGEGEGGCDVRKLREGLERVKREAREAREAGDSGRQMFKKNRPWTKIYRYIIYCVPTFSNPSSKTMSLACRTELVRIAREYDALIVTDDVYDFLQWSAEEEGSTARRWDKAVLPRIVDIDRDLDGGAERPGADGFGNAISNGSFSKIVGPGVRTGWNEGTPKFTYALSQTGSSRSGGAPSQLTATYMAQLLETGALQDHIHNVLQPSYAVRYRKLVGAIKEFLRPLGVEMMVQPQGGVVGGYFVWFSLPSPLTGEDVARRCLEEESLVVAFGRSFEVPGDEKSAEFERELRLCFAWEDEDNLAEGVKRLADVTKRMQATHQGCL